MVIFEADAAFLILTEQNQAALGEVIHNILEDRREVFFVLKFVKLYILVFYNLELCRLLVCGNEASAPDHVVFGPEFLFYIFVPLLLEKQYVLGATGHKNLVFDENGVAEVLNLKFLMIIGFNIGAIDSKGVALSIEAVNLIPLGIVEGSLWEIFRSADSLEFMIYQRLTDLSQIWIISKVVMNPAYSMKEVEEYFVVIYEATVGKRLVKA